MKHTTPLSLLLLATTTLQTYAASISGTIFYDLNSNGLLDTSSSNNDTSSGADVATFAEPGVSSVLIQLRSCNTDTYAVRLGSTKTDDNGEYSFDLSPVDGGECYFLRMDGSKYTFSDVGGGINANGRTVDMYLSREEGAVVNVGVVPDHVGSDGGSGEVMPTVAIVATTVAGVSNATVVVLPTISTTVAATDSAIADDGALNETDATVDFIPTTPSSTVDDGSVEDLFFDGSGNTTTTTDDISDTMGDNITVSGNATDVVVNVPAVEPSVNETAVDVVEDDVGVNATDAIIDINATDVVVDANVADGVNETIFDGINNATIEEPVQITSSPTESATEAQPTASPIKNVSKPPPKEDGPKGNGTATTDVNNSTAQTTQPTPSPTPKPTSCVGCALSLAAPIQVQLDNIPTSSLASDNMLIDDAKDVFEAVCGRFLNEQLSIATPPISNVECTVVGGSLAVVRRLNEQQQSRLRSNGGRRLAEVLLADVEVTGESTSTQSFQTAKDIPFKQLLAGTFTVQGFIFAEQLKDEESARGGETTFQAVQNIRGIATYDAVEEAEMAGDSEDSSSGGMPIGVMAGIAVGGLVVIILVVLIVKRARNNRRYANDDDDVESTKQKKLRQPTEDFFGSLKDNANNSRTKPSPANSSKTGPTVITPVSVRSNPSGVEVGFVPKSFSEKASRGGEQALDSSLNNRVRRDVMAPSGKLGIMVANTAGYGPAVHTIRPGSPMEGLVFVDDIIIAVNNINTREYTAEQITQIMKDTVGQERKITVLSAHR